MLEYGTQKAAGRLSELVPEACLVAAGLGADNVGGVTCRSNALSVRSVGSHDPDSIVVARTDATSAGPYGTTSSPMSTTAVSLPTIREAITRRWPEALRVLSEEHRLTFSTGLPQLDALFPLRGIPYGQLIEITGGISSGKTSLLFRVIAHATAAGRTVAYVDFGNSFFPDAAAAAGVDLGRLLVVKASGRTTEELAAGIRTGELLLRERAADIIVFDLAEQRPRAHLSLGLFHRLRLKTVRAKGLVIFLTQYNSELIPASMASLRLQIARRVPPLTEISIVKSRIASEGARVEVVL